MSDPKCIVHIKLYNKKLYDFLERYAQRGFFQRDKVIMTASSGDVIYPVENLSDIEKREWDENSNIHIIDMFGGDVYHVPEGIYDVIPCFLIYLAEMFHWERDSFLEFKESFLKEQSEIQKCFAEKSVNFRSMTRFALREMSLRRKKMFLPLQRPRNGSRKATGRMKCSP